MPDRIAEQVNEDLNRAALLALGHDDFAGPNRFGTAALAALDQYPDGADTVTLAPAWAEVDQSIAAGYQDGPVLLSSGESLHPITAEAIRTLQPQYIRAVGGGVSDAALREALAVAGLTPKEN